MQKLTQLCISTSYDTVLICEDESGCTLDTIVLKIGIIEALEIADVAQDNEILTSYIDKKGRIWIETKQHGVYMYNKDTGKVSFFVREQESPIVRVDAPLFMVLEDDKGNLWVQPRGGGFSYYDEDHNTLVPFYNDINNSDWRFSSLLHCGFIDRQNNLWLGTHSIGLEKITFGNSSFSSVQIDPDNKTPIANNTRSIMRDIDKNLWISTKDGKIHTYDMNNIYKGYLLQDGSIASKGSSLEGVTYCLMEDSKQNLWIGTKGHGLYLLKKISDYRYNVKQLKNDPSNIYTLSDNNIYDIFEDRDKNIWIGCYGGGLNLVRPDDKIINARNQLQQYPMGLGLKIRVINQDRYGNICVGTTQGLLMFRYNELLDQIKFSFYSQAPEKKNSLQANDIFDIVTTSDGKTYLATFGGGLAQIQQVDNDGLPTMFKSYTTKEGLPNNIVYQIIEDSQGKLWISSEAYISVINPQSNEVTTDNDIYRIIKGYSFTEGTKCITDGDIIYFGYSNGLLRIDSKIEKEDNYAPYVALSYLRIDHNIVPIAPNSILTKNIDDTPELVLDYKQNSFALDLAALDFSGFRNIVFSYKLEGVDKDWITDNGIQSISYNNLRPGNYRLLIRSTNKIGKWAGNERQLLINIVHSFWQTGVAYLLYFIIFSLILISIFKWLLIYYKMKYKIDMKEQEIEMKTRFFMDISHEIRTPLTLIVSPIENIMDNDKIDDVVEIKKTTCPRTEKYNPIDIYGESNIGF